MLLVIALLVFLLSFVSVHFSNSIFSYWKFGLAVQKKKEGWNEGRKEERKEGRVNQDIMTLLNKLTGSIMHQLKWN